MATNAPAPASATVDNPLFSFIRISELVYLYRPSDDRKPSASSGSSGSSSASTSPAVKSPRLILLASWMDAREPHIAKYTTRYQALYPESSIVLIRSFAYNFTTKAHLHPKAIEPAVPVIRSIFSEADAGGGGGGEAESGGAPHMLVHVFSNGGSATLRLLYGMYAQSATTPGGSPARLLLLPAHVTIFDSAPGQWRWRRSVAAFMISLARAHWAVRLVARPVLHLVSALYWVVHVGLGRPGALGLSWLAHNDRAQNRAERRRTYIYSEEDQLIDHRDVEEHAAAAARNGYAARLEKFSGSQHVAHVRVDEQRYWAIVRDTWENEPVGATKPGVIDRAL